MLSSIDGPWFKGVLTHFNVLMSVLYVLDKVPVNQFAYESAITTILCEKTLHGKWYYSIAMKKEQ